MNTFEKTVLDLNWLRTGSPRPWRKPGGVTHGGSPVCAPLRPPNLGARQRARSVEWRLPEVSHPFLRVLISVIWEDNVYIPRQAECV